MSDINYTREQLAAAIAAGAGASTGGVTWGAITGTLSTQSDLSAALPDPFFGMSRAQVLASSANVDQYFLPYVSTNTSAATAAHVSSKDVAITWTAYGGGTALNAAIWFDVSNKPIKTTAWS